jgi:hypothetical protein
LLNEILFYSFDDDSATDICGNYDGTVLSAESVTAVNTWDDSGYSLQTDSQTGVNTNRAVFINHSINVSTNGFSFSMWLYQPSGQGTYTIQHIIYTDPHFRLYSKSMGSMTLRTFSTNGPDNIDFSTPLNQWFHLAFTVATNKTYNIYVNNLLVNSGTYLTTPYTSLNNIYLGSFKYSGTSTSNLGFKGGIDQFRMFDTILTAGNVATLYNETKL